MELPPTYREMRGLDSAKMAGTEKIVPYQYPIPASSLPGYGV
jgi:hypothetical protein